MKVGLSAGAVLAALAAAAIAVAVVGRGGDGGGDAATTAARSTPTSGARPTAATTDAPTTAVAPPPSTPPAAVTRRPPAPGVVSRPYADVVSRLDGRRLSVEGRVIRLDAALIVCSGEGRASRVRGALAWSAFTCTQTTFRNGVDQDVTFDLRLLGAKKVELSNSRYGPS